jgi:hypothetical protein
MEMECKEGYEKLSPLCAVCISNSTHRYFEQLRRCVECKAPDIVAVVLFVLGSFAVIALAACFIRRHLLTNEVLASLKILVSFLTITSTTADQFGISWPPAFLRALAVLSFLSFDLSAFSGVFCLFRVSFFQNLLFSTLGLVAFLALLCGVSWWNSDLRGPLLQLAVYVLLFAYPALSTKLVATFSCHNVEGIFYLRADYSIECHTSQWVVIAGYASVFITIYVVAFPIFILWKLRQYGQHKHNADSRGFVFGFLLADYQPLMPCLMWYVNTAKLTGIWSLNH